MGISALISLLECRNDVSSHLKYYQLSSEILDYKLILFRSGHFDHDMEKKLLVCSKHPSTLRNIGNAVKVLVNPLYTKGGGIYLSQK